MRCLYYAFKKHIREKGYVGFRPTKMSKTFPWWPHAVHFSEECKNCDKLTSFVPFEKKIRWIFPFWFPGYVKKGDD